MQDGRVSSKRRRFCQTLVGAVLAPSIATAQTAKIRRIGVLDPGVPDAPEWLWKEAAPLRELGWLEGKNLRVERRYDYGRRGAQQALADELVRAKVELIVAGDLAIALAAKRATRTIPIVICGAGDFDLSGLVASPARPGANVTGIAFATAELTAKGLSLLKQALPRLERVGYVVGTFRGANRIQLESLSRSLNLAPMMIEIDGRGDLGSVFEQLREWRAQALVLRENIWQRRVEIVDGAMKHGLPTLATDSGWVREVGALMAYSSTWTEIFRLRAKFIDRILRGANPADLPVEQPTLFELVINLKTARALGLTIPKQLLFQANEVVE